MTDATAAVSPLDGSSNGWRDVPAMITAHHRQSRNRPIATAVYVPDGSDDIRVTDGGFRKSSHTSGERRRSAIRSRSSSMAS
jgi:hypothetical protein